MHFYQIILLAVIQGAAELLPVSSSAHVIVAEHCMGLDPARPDLTFLLVMLHTGTMFAVLFYFWPRWKPLLWPSHTAVPEQAPAAPRFHFVKMVVLATVCTGVLGLALKFLIENVVLERMLKHDKAEVEELFRELPLMAASLFAVGVLIIVAGFRETKTGLPAVSGRSAVWIGLVQGLCLPFRGFSRSGATISTALLRGVSRQRAEDFSFALAVVLTPPVIARELWRLLRARDWPGWAGLTPILGPGLAGMVCSFLAGLVALRLLSAALERGAWKYFGYYCIAAAVGVLAVWRFVPGTGPG
jgi:undecaprenyl-diphosphatase